MSTFWTGKIIDALGEWTEEKTGEKAVTDPNVAQEIALQQMSADSRRPVTDISLDRYPPLRSREPSSKGSAGVTDGPSKLDSFRTSEASGTDDGADSADRSSEESADETDKAGE